MEETMSNNGFRSKVVMGTSVLLALLGVSMPLRADEASEKLYKTKCAACHGADGKGETAIGKANKMRDLGSADIQKQSDEDLQEIITKGKGKMPAYRKSLKPERIKGLITYIRSLGKTLTMPAPMTPAVPQVKANKISCVSSGCHEVVHIVGSLKDVKFWKGGS
jgi:cytochrome c553